MDNDRWEVIRLLMEGIREETFLTSREGMEAFFSYYELDKMTRPMTAHYMANNWTTEQIKEALIDVRWNGITNTQWNPYERWEKEFEEKKRKLAAFDFMLQTLKAIKTDIIAEHGRVLPSRILQLRAAIDKAEDKE